MPETDPSLSESALESVRRNMADAGPAVSPGRAEEHDPEGPAPDLAQDEPAPGLAAALDPTRKKEPPKPGTYTAEGDPYTYRVDKDGSVTIMEGPGSVGAKIKTGAAYDAILGQIRAGQLKSSGPGVPGLAEDRPGMNAHLDDALDAAGEEDDQSLDAITRDAVRRNMGSEG